VTSLRQRVLDELQRRNYSPATTRGYILAMKQFAAYFGKSPERLGDDEIRRFETYLFRDKKLAPGTVRTHALRPLSESSVGPCNYFLSEIFLIPTDRPIDPIHNVFRFMHAVALAWIAHHNGIHSDITESNVILLGFGNGDVTIIFTMYQHRGRMGLRDVLQRRTLPKHVHQIPLMREGAPFHLLILVVIRHIVVTDEVADTRCRNGRFEKIRLRYEPVT
jgi:Phage integrase, N-terminal SAM-like domain